MFNTIKISYVHFGKITLNFKVPYRPVTILNYMYIVFVTPSVGQPRKVM